MKNPTTKVKLARGNVGSTAMRCSGSMVSGGGKFTSGEGQTNGYLATNPAAQSLARSAAWMDTRIEGVTATPIGIVVALTQVALGQGQQWRLGILPKPMVLLASAHAVSRYQARPLRASNLP